MTVALVLLGLGAVAALVVGAMTALRRAVEARLAAAHSELRRLGDAAAWQDRGNGDLRGEVSSVRGALEELRTREEERRAREEDGWKVLHRVAAVLTGGQSTGKVGENVLRQSLLHLPPSMIVTDFRVNGRVVEFGLILPGGRRLPIDSKWPADRELQALSRTTDVGERDRLVHAVEKAVAARAREVCGYLDPAVTAPVGVAAVPDAAYAVLRKAHAEAYRRGVVVVPYSMALPVVLFLHAMAARFGAVGDDVGACLSDLAAALEAMEGTLENKVARASAMLVNGTEELRSHVGKAHSVVARAREAELSQLTERSGNPIRELDPGRPEATLAGTGASHLFGLPASGP